MNFVHCPSNRRAWLSWLTLFLCLASFIHLLSISCFPKVLCVYPDELRYLHLSDAIANQGQILIRDSPSNFSKILYPLALYPASWFSGTEYYITAISVINSVLMTLVVPLCLWLAKLFDLNKTGTVFLLIMAVMVPDRVYAMTFMSENLYLPLGIFALIFAWKWMEMDVDEPHYLMYAGAYGFLVYLLYLNKEVGIVFLLAYAMVLLYRCVTIPTLRKWGTLFRMCVPFFVFSVIYVGMKLTLFSGMENVYSAQLIPHLGGLSDWITYLLHAYLLNLTWTLLAFFFFPVILPLIYWNRLQEPTRIRYLFMLFVLLITVAVVTYTISLNEDFPSLAPRQHLRYVSFLFLPFLSIFLHVMGKHWKVDVGHPVLLTVLSIVFLTSLFLAEMPFSSGSHVDQIMLKYVGQADALMEKGVILLLFVLIFWLLIRKHRCTVVAFACIVMTVCSWNMALAKNLFSDRYAISKDFVQPYVALSQQIKREKTIVYVDFETTGGGLVMSGTSRALDTYCINQVKILTRNHLQVFSDICMERGETDLNYLTDAKHWTIDMVDRIRKKYYPDVHVSPEQAAVLWNEICPILRKVEYVLIDGKYEGQMKQSILKLIGRYGNFLLYENMEPSRLPCKLLP